MENEAWMPDPFSQKPVINDIVGYQFKKNNYYPCRITKVWKYTLDLKVYGRNEFFINIQEGAIIGTFCFIND